MTVANTAIEIPNDVAARVTLVAAMNPCPCGHAGDPATACTCLPDAIECYHARLSGPLRMTAGSRCGSRTADRTWRGSSDQRQIGPA